MARYFDSTSGYTVDFGAISSLTGLGALSLSAWVNTSTLSGSGGGGNLRYILSKEYTSGSNAPFILRFEPTTPSFEFYINDGSYRGPCRTGAISANTWYHILAVYDKSLASGSQLSIYLNGSLAGNASGAGNNTAGEDGSPVRVGIPSGDGARVWYGSIAEVAAWDAALSASEAAALAKGVKAGRFRTSNLRLYAPLLGLHSSEPDFSQTKATGTVTGASAASHAPVVPFTPLRPTVFDLGGGGGGSFQPAWAATQRSSILGGGLR